MSQGCGGLVTALEGVSSSNPRIVTLLMNAIAAHLLFHATALNPLLAKAQQTQPFLGSFAREESGQSLDQSAGS